MINFLAGLPRSGSTLLGAILDQHPELHVSPTSDLVEIIIGMRNSFLNSDSFRAQGLKSIRTRIRLAMSAAMHGFYHDMPNVLDKNRAWPAYIELLERVLNRPVKIICPIRDVRDIVASFERLRNDNPLTAPHGVGPDYILQQTMMGRAQYLLRPDGIVGLAIRRMIDAIQRGFGDRILLIPYKKLIEQPQTIAQTCFLFLNLKPVPIDVDNLEGPDTSNDIEVWGLPLHSIRPKIEQNEYGWHDFITPEVANWIDSEFQMIQELANN